MKAYLVIDSESTPLLFPPTAYDVALRAIKQNDRMEGTNSLYELNLETLNTRLLATTVDGEFTQHETP